MFVSNVEADGACESSDGVLGVNAGQRLSWKCGWCGQRVSRVGYRMVKTVARIASLLVSTSANSGRRYSAVRR